LNLESEAIIKVEGVSKKYCKSLKHSMAYGMADIGRNMLGLSARSERLRKWEFWALRDVSFEVRRGEALGLIGPNGSGKTTLLKLLNGIFWPDKGSVAIEGRVGALIAVGAGFHPVLTGRENIYLNGAILGMSRREIAGKFDAIVDFADIGDFLETPVKHYSSGMYVRLGFAIAVHSEADILLVDEILAVGDKEFQIKCYQKMHEIRKKGTTVILVSHNEYTIRETTERCLVLDGGRADFQGPSEEGISHYLRAILERKPRPSLPGNNGSGKRGGRKAEILSLKFLDRRGEEVTYLESGEEIHLVLECLAREKLTHPIFGVNFYDDGDFMYCSNSEYENIGVPDLPQGRVSIRIHIPQFHLPANAYLCSAVLAEESPDNLIDWRDLEYRLTVGRARNARGSIKLATRWEIHEG
jgi:lipopolysaccharide transport system ATP-binding protein